MIFQPQHQGKIFSQTAFETFTSKYFQCNQQKLITTLIHRNPSDRLKNKLEDLQVLSKKFQDTTANGPNINSIENVDTMKVK